MTFDAQADQVAATSFEGLKKGVPTVVAEDEATQTIVTTSDAGWTTQVVYKPGFEPVEEPSDHEKLVALLVEKNVLTAEDATAIGVDAAAITVGVAEPIGP